MVLGARSGGSHPGVSPSVSTVTPTRSQCVARALIPRGRSRAACSYFASIIFFAISASSPGS